MGRHHKPGCIVIGLVSVPRPSFDQIVALCWLGELDDEFGDGQPLLLVEIHLILRVLKLVEVLDSRNHAIKVWLTLHCT